MLEIRHLQVLRAVSLEGTVTGAAERLGFSASAISQQLTAIGRLIGQPVVRKHGRGIVLTAVGMSLAARAEDILAAVSLAESAARASGSTTGELTVATFPSAGRRLVVPALSRLASQAPGLQIRLIEAEPERALPMLQFGSVDLAVVYSYNILPFEPPGILLFPLQDEPMFFFCSEAIAERLKGGLAATAAALRALPWIAGPDDSGDHEVTRRICGALGFEPPIVHSAEDYSLYLALAAAGLGVGFIPLAAVPELPPGVRALSLPGVLPVRQLWVAMRPGHEQRPGNGALLAALREHAALSAAEASTDQS